MHVDAIHVVRGGHDVIRGLLLQRVMPVFLHPFDAFAHDELFGMLLRIATDGVIPVIPHQRVSALLFQPGESPLVVPAEVVTADHDALAMSSRFCGSSSGVRFTKRCTQEPFPPFTRAARPAGTAMASLTK